MSDLRRIMIVGQPGAGKSTLARALGQITGLPVVHIDLIHWQAGWVERDRDDKTRICLAVEAQDAWIFEGGHSVTWDNRMMRADLVIWLNLPLGLRMGRVLARSWRWRGRTRPDLPPGCPERLGAQSLTFWRYMWRTRISGRANIARLFARAPPGKARVILRGAAEVAAWTVAVSRDFGVRPK